MGTPVGAHCYDTVTYTCDLEDSFDAICTHKQLLHVVRRNATN